MKWKNLQMPKSVEVDSDESNDRYGKFVVEPLERGFGITLGSSFRRVLLSSLQGAAVTSVRFDGALHEFSTLPGVIEDATEIILNLKQARFKLHGDGPKKGMFEAKKKGELRAGDLLIDSDVEILNPDLHVATINSDGDLRMEVEVGSGQGYVPADQHEVEERPIGVIPVDSLFSPVLNANYKVEQARIGQRIDYDKLTLEIWTDGSILPSDALAVAAKLLRDHFNLFVHFEEPIEEVQEEEVDEQVLKVREQLDRSVEELELSVRSSNCLRQAEIHTIGDLVQKTEPEMLKYRNFGRKSLKEIQDVLVDMGLGLGFDLDQYDAGRDKVAVSTESGEAVESGTAMTTEDAPTPSEFTSMDEAIVMPPTADPVMEEPETVEPDEAVAEADDPEAEDQMKAADEPPVEIQEEAKTETEN